MSIGKQRKIKTTKRKFSSIFRKNENRSARIIANDTDIIGENVILSNNVLFFKIKNPGKKKMSVIAIN